MGQYVVNESEGRYQFNLCASNGHVAISSIVYPSRHDAERGIEDLRREAPNANIEDGTEKDFERVPAPKFRIYQDLDGEYFFAFIDATGEDLALSHKYSEKESMLRRIERVMAECDASVAMG